jgi:hypothetical protein
VGFAAPLTQPASPDAHSTPSASHTVPPRPALGERVRERGRRPEVGGGEGREKAAHRKDAASCLTTLRSAPPSPPVHGGTDEAVGLHRGVKAANLILTTFEQTFN